MISPVEVKKIAGLAKLQVGAAEAELYAEQLSAVLAYMDQLQEVEVDLTAIDWQALMPDFSNRVAEDIPSDWPADEREIALSAADLEKGLVKVKKVL